MNKDVKFKMKRDVFIAALNEVNAFLSSTKVLEGANIISLKIDSKEQCLVFTGIGLDSSLISRDVDCEGIEGSAQIYFDGPATLSKVNKLEEELNFEFSTELRRLSVTTESSKIIINAFSELDFDEDGKVVENTESTYKIPEAPIRNVLGRSIKDIGEFGSFEVKLNPFKVGLKSVSVTPFKGEGKNSEIIKLCAIPGENSNDSSLTISGSDGLVFGLSKIVDCKVDNPKNEKELGFSLKKEMVDKLSKTMDAITNSVSKVKKLSKDDCKIKVSFGKAMISMEVEDTIIHVRRYNELVNDITNILERPFSWYGIVDVSKLKKAIEITKGASKSGISSEFYEDEFFTIDLENKKLQLCLSSSIGEGGISSVEYSQLQVPDYKDTLGGIQIYVQYNKIYTALNLMIDSQALVRIHEIEGSNGLGIMTFVNANNHAEYGFTHGIMVTIK